MTITETEIDDWVAKAEAVQQAIRGIAEGNDVNLEAFGISNQNVEVLEDDQQREVLDKNGKDLGAKRQIDQDQERLLWWDEAKRRFGSVGVSAVAETSPRTVALPIPVNSPIKFSDRFSTNYSRWSDSAFSPDDPATMEENDAIKKRKEVDELKIFESSNTEFCKRFSDDMGQRIAENEKRKIIATKHRVQGNHMYKTKKYERALDCYKLAMKEDPFAVNVLTNIALCHSKLQRWEDCLEFSSRALFLDNTSVKALCQSSKAYFELHQMEKAESVIQAALLLDPKNVEVITYCELLRDEIYEIKAVKTITAIRNNDTESKERSNKYWENLRLLLEVTESMDDYLNADLLTAVDRIIQALLDCGDECFQDLHLRLVCTCLHKSPLLRAYMRSTGHLNGLCNLVIRAAKDLEKNEVNLVIAFDLLSACLLQDSRSQFAVGKWDLIEGIKHFLSSKIIDTSDAKLVVSAWKLYSAGLKPHSKKGSSFLHSFFMDDTLMQFASAFLIDLFTTKELIIYQETGAEIIANLLLSLTEECERGTKFALMFKKNDSHYGCNLLDALVSVLMLSSGNQARIASGKTRESLVTAIHRLSLAKELHPFFVSSVVKNIHGASSISVLLEVAIDFKKETDATREAALACLVNITTNDSSSDVCKEICTQGGVEGLLYTMTQGNEEIHPTLKLYSFTLLARLASLPIGRLKLGSRKEIISKFADIFVEKIFDRDGETENLELKNLNGRIVVKAIKIVAEIKEHPNVDRFVDALVLSLPVPKKDYSGSVTADTVCQLPDQSNLLKKLGFENNSKIIQAFYCSVLSALINSLNYFPSDEESKLDSILVERLVCLIANHGSFHRVILTTAAALLARIMRSPRFEAAGTHCRELHGMHMLLDLNRRRLI